MQRNPYWPLNGPSFFSTIEIPSQCISLTVQQLYRTRAELSCLTVTSPPARTSDTALTLIGNCYRFLLRDRVPEPEQ